MAAGEAAKEGGGGGRRRRRGIRRRTGRKLCEQVYGPFGGLLSPLKLRRPWALSPLGHYIFFLKILGHYN